MKKFITTAALVAASTALASAATVVFSFNADVAGATKITATNVDTSTLTASADALNSGAEFSVSATVSSKWWSDGYSLSSLSGTALSTLATNTGIAETTISSISKGLEGGNADTSMKFSITGLEKNSDYVLSLVLTQKGNASKAGTLTLDAGTFVLGSYGSSDLTSVSSISDISIPRDNSDSTYFPTVVVLTVTSDDSGTITLTQSNKASVALFGIADAAAIPEPSAFGLLAGIGALALAVSRRRRSR